MTFRSRTVAAIIEFSDNRILLIKRATVPFLDYWALVGGRVNSSEKVEQAILREVKEETGLDVEIIAKIGEYHESGLQDGIEYDYYPACFVTRPIGGKIKRQETEIKQIKLFSLDEIPKKLAFEHSRMIQDYILRKERSRQT